MTTDRIHRATRPGAFATVAAIVALVGCSAPTPIEEVGSKGVAARPTNERGGVLAGIADAKMQLANQSLEQARDALFQVRSQLEQTLDASPLIQSKVGIANVNERLKTDGPTAALAALDAMAPQLAQLETPEPAESARAQLADARGLLEQGEVGAAVSSLMAADDALPLTERELPVIDTYRFVHFALLSLAQRDLDQASAMLDQAEKAGARIAAVETSPATEPSPS
jgi:hypothetical protein